MVSYYIIVIVIEIAKSFVHVLKIKRLNYITMFECKDPISWFMLNKKKLPLKKRFCFLPYISTVSHSLLQWTEFLSTYSVNILQ